MYYPSDKHSIYAKFRVPRASVRTWRLFALAMILLFVLVFLPEAAGSCPKCYAASNERVLNAYYLSIAFMGLVPFGVVAMIAVWIRRQQRKH